MSKVMFYAQHLLGIGHLKRASILARAMADAGLDVSVALGGREVPDVSFAGCARILLPAAHARDATFKVLLDEHDAPVDDAWRDHRASRLAFEFDSLRPDVLIIELFPFGRRMFAFELLPLLAAARATVPVTRVLCSVRDILVPKTDPERNRKAAAFAATWFDAILVHGDPAFVPIEASFPAMEAAGDKLIYTGYVAEIDDEKPLSPIDPVGRDEVIVSVGGGAVGEAVLRAALAARPLSRYADRVWRVLTGPNLPDAVHAELAWAPPAGVIVERWRTDLPRLLRHCLVSVSQAGYNTAVDVLAACARAVLVPFADAAESEQPLRARLLAERGLAVQLDPAGLTAEGLARAVDAAAALPWPTHAVDLDGAAATVRLVERVARGEPLGART